MSASEQRKLQDEQGGQGWLLEQAPGFIIIMRGAEHVVQFVNGAHRALFSSGDWVGKPIREAFPSIADKAFFGLLDEVYRTGETYKAQSAQVRYRRSPTAPEEVRYLTFIFAPFSGEDGRVSGIFCEGLDVTEIGWAETRKLALAELSETIRETDDPDDLAYAAAEILGRSLLASRAGYGTIDTARETIAIDRDWNASGIRSLAGVLHFRDYGTYIEDLKRGETVVCVDAEADPRTVSNAAALKAISAQSFVNMPVTEQGGFVALLYLNHEKPRDWAADELAFIREVAERTRTAVERRRAEAAVRDNEARLRFLDALGKETARSTDADAIMSITTRMLGRHVGVDVCAYADMEPDQDHFTIRGDWSAPGAASIVGYYRLADFGRLAVENLGAGRPLVINDNRAELPPEEAATFLGIGLAATICMPLVKEGRLTALMAIHSATPRCWTASELALLTEVTERSWAHIERVRSEAAVRRTEQRFREELEKQVAERTAALQESEASIRTIFETSHLYQGLLKSDGAVLYANAISLAEIGSRLDEVAGVPFWETPWFTGTPGMPESVKAAVARVAAGDIESHQITLDLPTGIRNFDFTMRPVQNETGDVIAIVPEAVDTTARVKAEQALQQAQKMEAIGNLTGGIAHDFNNLLMAVCGSLELLRKRMPGDPEMLKLIDNATEAAKRGTSLTRRMLAFARKQDLKTERIDAEQLVGGMTELLQRSLGPTIAVDVRFAGDLPLVETDPNQLESALLNLAVNARDAMDGEGQIVIAGREEQVNDQELGLRPGRYLCLSVTDNGEGMDERTLERAAEPFFTTKGVGKGTGLGLSMVQGLVEQSGGKLRLKSKPGSGTTAEIWLPAAVGPELWQVADLQPAREARSPTVSRPLTILAVDDDALVLMSTAAMLEDLGHSVVPVSSGRKALEHLTRTTFDLVITDQAMPLMTGTQLAAEVRARRPDQPIIIATGYADLPPGAAGNLPRLSKPFSQSDLAEAVSKAAAGRSLDAG